MLTRTSRSHLRHHFFEEKLPGFHGESRHSHWVPQQVGREGFFVQLWSQRASISTMAPGDGTKAKHKCPCMLYGHEASMWETMSRAEASCLGKKEEIARKRGLSVQPSSCVLLAGRANVYPLSGHMSEWAQGPNRLDLEALKLLMRGLLQAPGGDVSSCQCVNPVSHTCWCQAVCSDGL